MLVIPFGKKPDDNDIGDLTDNFKGDLEAKDDRYDILSVLCMSDSVGFLDLKESVIKTSYRDDPEGYWGDIENFVESLIELEESGAIEVENGVASITDTGMQEWKKVTVENDVDFNIYV